MSWDLSLIIQWLFDASKAKRLDSTLRYLGALLLLYSLSLVLFPEWRLDRLSRYFYTWPMNPLSWLSSMIMGTALIVVRTRYAYELYHLLTDTPSVWVLFDSNRPFRTYGDESGVSDLDECPDKLVQVLQSEGCETKDGVVSRIQNSWEDLQEFTKLICSAGVSRRTLYRMIWVNFTRPEVQRIAFLRSRRRISYAIALLCFLCVNVAAHSWERLESIETRLPEAKTIARQTIADVRFALPLSYKERDMLNRTVAALWSEGAIPDDAGTRCEDVLLWYFEGLLSAETQDELDSVMVRSLTAVVDSGRYCSDLALLLARLVGTYGDKERCGSPNKMIALADSLFARALRLDPVNVAASIGRLTGVIQRAESEPSVQRRFRIYDSCLVEFEGLGQKVRTREAVNSGLVLGRIRNNAACVQLQIFSDFWLRGGADEMKPILVNSRYAAIVDEPLGFLKMLADSIDIALVHYPHYGVHLSAVEVGAVRAKFLLSQGYDPELVVASVIEPVVLPAISAALVSGWPRVNLENESERRRFHLDVVDGLVSDPSWFEHISY